MNEVSTMVSQVRVQKGHFLRQTYIELEVILWFRIPKIDQQLVVPMVLCVSLFHPYALLD